MQVTQLLWDAANAWRRAPSTLQPSPSTPGHDWAAGLGDPSDEPDAECADAQLVLVFGSRPSLADDGFVGGALAGLRRRCPDAAIVCCSGGGQISGVDVVDDALIATTLCLDHGTIIAAATTHAPNEDSAAAGARLAAELPTDGLRYVMVLSDGLHVNGSALVRGMTAVLPEGVTLSGGLAADSGEFAATLVGLNEAPAPDRIVAIGFYGERLVVGHGSLGGWEMFGPDRLVTRATGNVVHELDGQPALALYKRYLGSFAEGLPANALLFPLCVQTHEHAETGLVRTVLGVNEADDSMTFAGDVPEGAHVRLMRTSREGLVAGAEGAAAIARRELGGIEPSLVLLVSCIGRRLVLKHRVDEEVESARDAMGPAAVFTGFYSFGEIAPSEPHGCSALHNQTMTITALAES
jgi:hypothetical protein